MIKVNDDITPLKASEVLLKDIFTDAKWHHILYFLTKYKKVTTLQQFYDNEPELIYELEMELGLFPYGKGEFGEIYADACQEYEILK